MKLNADIVFDNLIREIPAEMTGYRENALRLERPEFFLEASGSFSAGHLYVMQGDRISRRAVMEKGAVVVCIGDIPQMSYFHDRCCFIQIRDGHADLFRIFNLLQSIFNRYDAWSERLSSILAATASIEEMAEASLSIFENPILILDASFKFIAYAGYESLDEPAEAFEHPGASELSLGALEQFMEAGDLLMDRRDPILLNIRDHMTLSANLFDLEEYIGSLTIEYRGRTHRESDSTLCSYLADFLTAAIKKNHALINSDRNVLRRVFRNIIDGLPIDTTHRKRLETMDIHRRFVCTILHLNDRFAQIPVEYVCQKLENVFPGSITFESKANIISFIEIEQLENGRRYREVLEERIALLAGAMDLKAGVSNDFNDPYSAHLYYAQAQAAMENGLLIAPDEMCYHFEDYALMELIINAQSDLPLDMYYPAGLRRILEHDKNASISYVETLCAYLDNNMSIAKTSAALYIHRSTLLERLSRIQRELGEDLTDPDARLKLQILLRAMKLRETIRLANEKR